MSDTFDPNEPAILSEAEQVPDVVYDDPVIQNQPIDEVKPEEELKARPQQKTILSYSTKVTGKWDPAAITISMPSGHDSDVRKKIEAAPNVNLVDSEKAAVWAQTIQSGAELTTFNEGYLAALEDPNAEFAQEVEVNGVKLFSKEPAMREVSNINLTGERAILRVTRFLGLGSIFQAAMWHTGIWITFKAPSDSELLELNRLLIADKIRLGRASFGLALSNTTSFTTDRLVDFAIAHIYDSTLDISKVGNKTWKQILSVHDINNLLWGLMCATYPKGFQYRRACVENPEKCNHVEEALLGLFKLQVEDGKALTPWQKVHMYNRQSGTASIADVERYQKEMLKTQQKEVEIKGTNDGVMKVILKCPNIEEHIRSGQRWVGDITSMVEEVLGTEADEGERNNQITRHGKASSLRQFGHWVKSIEFAGVTINDVPTIEDTLSALSPDDVLRTELLSKIIDYINTSPISVIGIEAFNCPVCGTPQDTEKEGSRFVNLIPLDVMKLFFALRDQRIERISYR